MTSKNETATIAAWTEALKLLSADMLDRVIKATAREFGVDRKDPEQLAELDAALESREVLAKANYVMGFVPLHGDDGLVAFLITHSARWGIDLPSQKKVRTRKSDDDGLTVGETKKRATALRREKARPKRTKPTKERGTRKTRTADKGGVRKASGGSLMLKVPGDHLKLAMMMGFRKVPDERKPTVLKQSSKLTVTAQPGVGIVASFDGAGVSSAVRFARKRLETEHGRVLRKVLIQPNGKGALPELSDAAMDRLGLKVSGMAMKLVSLA